MLSFRNPKLSLFARPALVIACGPTEKGQTRDWENNGIKVQTLSSKYPGFKKQLEDQLAQAKVIFEKAKGLSDEKERAQKMKDANEKVGAFLSFFDSYESKLKRIEDLKADREINRLPAYKVNPSMDLATRIVADTRALLANAAPDSLAAAQAKLREASEQLDKALRPLDELKREIERKKEKERKKKADERKAAAGPEKKS
jgi:coenzyme F420-reducing hydrogenase alpha subunit